MLAVRGWYHTSSKWNVSWRQTCYSHCKICKKNVLSTLLKQTRRKWLDLGSHPLVLIPTKCTTASELCTYVPYAECEMDQMNWFSQAWELWFPKTTCPSHIITVTTLQKNLIQSTQETQVLWSGYTSHEIHNPAAEQGQSWKLTFSAEIRPLRKSTQRKQSP